MKIALLILFPFCLLLASPSTSQQKPPAPRAAVITLPLSFVRYTGDLDVMVKKRNIRAIVLLDPIGFFLLGSSSRDLRSRPGPRSKA